MTRRMVVSRRGVAVAAAAVLVAGGVGIAHAGTQTDPQCTSTSASTPTYDQTSRGVVVTTTVSCPDVAATTVTAAPVTTTVNSTVTATQTVTVTSTPNSTATASPAPPAATTSVSATTGPTSASPAVPACDYKPSAANAGAYGNRTAGTGSSITTAGTTISAKTYPGDLTVYAANVTLDNVSVAGKLLFSGAANGHVNKVTAQEIHFSSSDNFLVENSVVQGGVEDAMHITSDNTSLPKMTNGTVKYTYIGVPGNLPAGLHFDAMQLRGITTFSAFCNSYDVGPSRTQDNALVYAENANGGESNLYVHDNWMVGSAWTFMLSGPPGAGDYQLKSNVINQVTSPNGPPQGAWGVCVNFSNPKYKPAVSGNTYNGAAVSPCQS